jgi:hypothetical protein
MHPSEYILLILTKNCSTLATNFETLKITLITKDLKNFKIIKVFIHK